MSDPYAVGTVTVANGATAVVGTDTFWVGKVRKNDMLFDPAQGLQARVTADPTDNEALAITAWPGTSLVAAAYEIIPAADSTTSSARLRDLLAQMSVIEANGRGLFYLFSDSVTDADPGAGYLRLNNATIGSATAAYIDNLDANGATVSAVLDSWDDEATAAARGQLWLRSVADPTAFHAFKVSGSVVDGTGYRKLTLTYIGGSNTFSADDEMMVMFSAQGADGTNAILGVWQGAWVTATGYGVDDLVEESGSTYICIEAHTSGTFATDLAAAKWELAVEKGDQGDQGPKGAQWEGAWVTATAYAVDDIVRFDGSSYICLVAHTSGTFSTDLAALDWELMVEKGSTGATGAPGGGLKGIACRVVATANVAIATALEAGDSIDSVTLSGGDLVLLTAQTAPEENGVYIASVSGAAARHTDFDAWDDFPGSYFPVNEGTVNADTLWRCTSNAGGTLDTTALVFEEFGSVDGGLPPRYWYGFQHSNSVGTPNTQIDIAAGATRDSTDALDIVNTSGTIDLATTGANGLDAGSLANTTWYYTFAIAKDDGTSAFLASTSPTAPTLPATYTKFRRIGSFRTNGSAQVLPFIHVNDTWYWATTIRDKSAAADVGTTLTALALSVPRVYGVTALFSVTGWNAGGAVAVNVVPGFLTSTANNGFAYYFDTAAGGTTTGRVMVNASAQVGIRASLASTNMVIDTAGWVDPL